jgi:hypothetical protein
MSGDEPSIYGEIFDWPCLRKRYLAFWKNRISNDSIIAHIQNPNPNRPPPEPWMLEASADKYLVPEKFYRLACWRRSGWNWHADLFQYLVPSYGPNIFAGFCGGRPQFGRDTVWHEPVIESLDEADRIHFDEDNKWWKAHLETTAYFSKQCAGKRLLAMTDFGGPADWISVLMGAENFMLGVIEEPDRMRDFALRLAGECNRAFDLISPLINKFNDGMVNWMPCWSDRRLGTVQDDIAVNLSPELYNEVFVPALRIMAGHTAHTVLHWHDGAQQHLDNLMKIDEIDLVQYGHDPNSPSFRNGLENMRKIQSAGKRLFISCVEAVDAEFFISNLDPNGLMMIINTPSDEASRKMCDNVRTWTQQRRATVG